MEQSAIFEEKIYLSPKDLNSLAKKTIDDLLLEKIREKLENRCSQHGFVIPSAGTSKSVEIISRSMGSLENGRYTGNVVYHIEAKGRVYNPANGTRIVGTILKRNKMGLYIIYRDAIRVLVPRDLHLGNEEFEALEVGDSIEIEIRKSRFQIHDQFILSVGVYIQRKESDDGIEKDVAPLALAPAPAPAPALAPALAPAEPAPDAATAMDAVELSEEDATS